MRNLFKFSLELLIAGLLSSSLTAQRPTIVSGRVSLFGSKTFTGKKIYLSDVTVDSQNSNPDRTDVNGFFQLTYFDLPVGTNDKLTFEKYGYVLVPENNNSVTVGQADTFQVTLAPLNYQEVQKKEIFSRITLNAKKRLYKRLNKIRNDLIRARKIGDIKEIDKCEENIKFLESKLDIIDIQANDFAEVYKNLNFDDASGLFAKALHQALDGEFEASIVSLQKLSLDDTPEWLSKNQKILLYDSLQRLHLKAQITDSLFQRIQSLELRAQVEKIQFDYIKALKTYRVLLRVDSSNNEYNLGVGYCFQMLQMFDSSKKYYGSYLDKIEKSKLLNDPRNMVKIAQVWINLSAIEIELENFDEAEKNLKISYTIIRNIRSVSLDMLGPQLAILYSNLSLVYIQQFDIEKASNYIRAAGEILGLLEKKDKSIYYNFFSQVYLRLATLYAYNRNYKRAKHEYAKMISNYYTFHNGQREDLTINLLDAYINWGELSLSLGDGDEAYNLFKMAYNVAEKLNRRNSYLFEIELAGVYGNLGRASFYRKEFKKAENYFNQAISIRKSRLNNNFKDNRNGYVAVLKLKGELFHANNQLENAIRVYDSALYIIKKYQLSM